MHKVISRLITASLLFANPAVAGELAVAAAKKTKVKPARPSRLTLFDWIETGITVNFASPEDHQNSGRLLDDRSNEPLLNQVMVGAERPARSIRSAQEGSHQVVVRLKFGSPKAA